VLIKPEDLDFEYEHVFEEYLEELNSRKLAVNSKILKKLQKNITKDNNNHDVNEKRKQAKDLIFE